MTRNKSGIYCRTSVLAVGAMAMAALVAVAAEEIGQHKIEKESESLSMDARDGDERSAQIDELDARAFAEATVGLQRFRSDDPVGLAIIVR